MTTTTFCAVFAFAFFGHATHAIGKSIKLLTLIKSLKYYVLISQRFPPVDTVSSMNSMYFGA